MKEKQLREIGETVHYFKKAAAGMEALVPGLGGWNGPWPAIIMGPVKHGGFQELRVLVPSGHGSDRTVDCKFWNGTDEPRPNEYWTFRNQVVAAHREA